MYGVHSNNLFHIILIFCFLVFYFRFSWKKVMPHEITLLLNFLIPIALEYDLNYFSICSAC